MTRIIMLGIDGMDSELLDKFNEQLPTIEKIKEKSPKIDSKSVFPPDSETAWASIYTGLNPARHGVLHFLDPLEKSMIFQTKDSDSTHVRGKTFWDIAGKYGKKVCILLPHIGYPVWNVNGVMIGRSSVKDDVQVYPPDISNEFNLNDLNTIKGFPGRGGISYKEYVEKHEKLLQSTIDVSLKMLNKEKWDLFFMYSSILDVVPHFFWKYFDEDDPTYPGDNPYKNVIKDFYKSHDEMIKKISSELSEDDILIILSDHGHGRRPVKTVNINEMLRKKNLLKQKKNDASFSTMELLKREMLLIAGKYNLENFGSKLLQYIPKLRKTLASPTSIDVEGTIACASDLSGIKSYSYGGIRINRKLINDDDICEKIKNDIIDSLNNLREPTTNTKLVKWAKRREELYQGPYIDKYPEILLDLIDDYGIGTQINSPLMGNSPSHGIVPGSHKGDNAVFYIVANQEITVKKDTITLMDVAPTVLELLDIDCQRFDFDGKSILEKNS